MGTKRRTVIEGMLDYSVRLNGVLIPISAAERVLARHAQSLTAMNDSEDYPISLVASCICVRYRGRYLVLCTRHQLKGWNLEKVALLTEDGRYVISSGGVRHFEGINESDFHDLAAFDFTEPCLEWEILQERFFRLEQFPPDAPSDQIVCLIASGYPFGDQDYDLENGRHLGQAKRILVCVPDGPEQPSDPALMRLRPVERLSFSPDGMSGGPAFVVQMVMGEPHAFFAGIITRAGPEYLYIVRVGFVRRFMDMWIDHRTARD
jgi:hypothetical protein